MFDQGWISLHRKMAEWEWYDDSKMVHLYIHCLIKSNHKAKKWRGVVIEPGQFITSYQKLSEQLPLSVQQVRTAINKLKSTGEITIKTTSKYSMISITNWNEYQSSNKQNNKQVTNKQQISNKQVTTNNNDNNENNDNKKQNISFVLPEKVDPDTWKAFTEHRVKLKAPMTERAKQLIINKLDKLNGNPNDILNQSIESGWKGVFELKEEIKNGSHQQNNKQSLTERATAAREEWERNNG